MLKVIWLLAVLWAAIPISLVMGEEKQFTWIPTPEERASMPWIAAPDEVFIEDFSVAMPLGRILLARKGSEYCALKFTNTWLGKKKGDHYSSYEFYYQSDGSGDFSKNNVVSGTGELFYPKVRMWMGMYVYTGVKKDTIQCGGLKLGWGYPASVGLRDRKSRDAEFAPTPWTSITQVNIHDPRIKWYAYDKSRKRITVHIDQLWDNPK